VKDLQEQIDAYRDLSTSLAREEAWPCVLHSMSGPAQSSAPTSLTPGPLLALAQRWPSRCSGSSSSRSTPWWSTSRCQRVEEADPGIADQIDAAYRTKYHRYGDRFISLMVSPEARAATIKLVPRVTTQFLIVPERRAQCRSEGLETATWKSRPSGSAAWG
jgi:hypothetical protein